MKISNFDPVCFSKISNEGGPLLYINSITKHLKFFLDSRRIQKFETVFTDMELKDVRSFHHPSAQVNDWFLLGQKLIIPENLPPDILHRIHEGHLGM